MLNKTNRLAKDKDIQAAFARGRSFFNPFYRVKFLPKPEGRRFVVVVSTKVFKKAVDRNRLKRLLREQLRPRLQEFKTGDYVISASPKLSGLKEADRLKQFLLALNNIR